MKTIHYYTYTAILVISFLTLSVDALAQKAKFGMTMGCNFGKWVKESDAFAYDLAQGMNSTQGFSGFTCNTDKRFGFDIGIIAIIPKSKLLWIQPELIYNQKGTKFNLDGYMNYQGTLYKVNEVMTVRSDYVDLNLLAKCYLRDKLLKPYVCVGPGVGILSSSTMRIKATVLDETDFESQAFDELKVIDAQMNAAFGLEYLESIGFELRYQYGFLPILDSDNDYKIMNNGILLNINVIF